jgi:hypothetical protein
MVGSSSSASGNTRARISRSRSESLLWAVLSVLEVPTLARSRVHAGHRFDSEAQAAKMRDALEARFGGNAVVTSGASGDAHPNPQFPCPSARSVRRVSRRLIPRPLSSLAPPREAPNWPPDTPGVPVLRWRWRSSSPGPRRTISSGSDTRPTWRVTWLVARKTQASGAAYAPLFAEPLDRSVPLHGSEETQ